LDILDKTKINFLPQFENELKIVKSTLEHGENICFCSAVYMGDNYLLEYLSKRLDEEKKYLVIYNPWNELNFNEIKKIKTNKKIVLIIPWRNDPIDEFYGMIENFFLSSNTEKITTIIRLPYDVLINPSKYFPRSIRPLSYIYI